MNNICDLLERWNFAQVGTWIKFINAPATSTSDIPDFDRQSYFNKSMFNLDVVLGHCARLAGVDVATFKRTFSVAIDRWFISPHIDMYAQTCLASKPALSQTGFIPDHRVDVIFKDVPWVLVSTVDQEQDRGFARQQHTSGDEVTIHVGPKIPNRGPNRFTAFVEKFRSEDRFLDITWKTSSNKARQFLLEYAKRGRGVVVPGNLYDYGKGDLLERRILWDIPHCVGHATDIKTLWFRLGFESTGLKSFKRIAYGLVSSEDGHGEFGFLAFKPVGAKFPVVVVPTLQRYAQRAMSVVSQFPSPHGCSMFYDPTLRGFADGCEASLAATIQGLEESFVQAPEMVSRWRTLTLARTG
jgi:hypothetical protein